MNEISVIARAAGSAAIPTPVPALGSTSLSDEARAFLQRRVASAGLVLAAIFGLFAVYRVIAAFLEEESYRPWVSVPFLVCASVVSLVQWLLCRRRRRSLSAIRWIEAVCLTLSCASIELMAFQIPYVIRPDNIILMAVGLTLVLRSIYVPSSLRRSMVIGAMMGIPLLVTLYFVHVHGHDPGDYTSTAHGYALEPPSVWAMRWGMMDILWWVAFMVIAGATSHVIYGLRAEVRDARKLGQYTLIEQVGEGGMGAVYRASHAMLRRPTAVKLLPPERFGEENLARFEREVQLTSVLTHPNTVRVFDYGRTPDGIFYYAMEFLDGANLAEVVAAGGRMPAGRVIRILEQVAGALAEAHAIGLIHRDIKPANILLTEQGGMPDAVKVVDFGLVKEVGPEAPAHEATALAITQANSLAGTPHYMAPEAISSPATIDARVDVYALGAVGYFLLTARDVFTGNSVVEVFAHHLHTKPVPPSERIGAPVSSDLEQLILSCLEKDPQQRPAGAREMKAALHRLRDHHAWTDDDATRWWTEHGARLRAKRTRATTGVETTLAIDLGERMEPIAAPERRFMMRG